MEGAVPAQIYFIEIIIVGNDCFFLILANDRHVRIPFVHLDLLPFGMI